MATMNSIDNQIVSGDFTIDAGNLDLPLTSSSSQGVININGTRFIHNYNGNTYIGAPCGNFSVTGTSNIAIGNNSMLYTTSGNSNVSIGSGSGANITTGTQNMFLGTYAGATCTTGGINAGIGNDALVNLVSGSNNTAIGGESGKNYTTSESNNILLNNSGVVGESNVTRIGSSQTTCYVAGINGVTVGASGTAVYVDNNNQLGTIVSSARFKENIQDMKDQSNDIYKLRPVTFNYKLDQNKNKQYGLIAEEVKEVMPQLVTYDLEGNIQAVKYHELVPMLLNEVIKLRKEVSQLK